MNMHHLLVVVPPVIDIRLSLSEKILLTIGIDLAQHGESSFRAGELLESDGRGTAVRRNPGSPLDSRAGSYR